jgi:hypothetical protein
MHGQDRAYVYLCPLLWQVQPLAGGTLGTPTGAKARHVIVQGSLVSMTCVIQPG